MCDYHNDQLMKTLNTISSDRLFESNFMRLYVRLRKASNWLLDEQAQIAKANDITVQQLYVMQVLRELDPKAATINQLIDMSVDKQSNASRLVEKLVQKELVQRSPDENDRRRVGVKLTKDGKLMLKTVDNAMEGLEAQIMSIPANDREQLDYLLKMLEATMMIRNEDTENPRIKALHNNARTAAGSARAAQRDTEGN